MAKYKVYFSGFAYVEADSAEDAEEVYHYGDTDYEEQQVDAVEEVDEFVVKI